MKRTAIAVAMVLLLVTATPAQEAILPPFSDVTDEAGVGLAHAGTAPGMPLGNGVAWGDFDRDGWPDLFVSNQGGPNALYRNLGDGRFVDVAHEAGVSAAADFGSGAVFGDYDNDGRLDLFVANIGANRLFRNLGDGRFEDVTAFTGLGDEGYSQSAAWGDYDNDGWLDLYVSNHVGPEGSADRLWHNRGDGRFEDASGLLPWRLRSGAAFVASFVDYDDDGDQDLYVINDKWFGETTSNVLWRNEGGRARLTGRSVTTGAFTTSRRTPAPATRSMAWAWPWATSTTISTRTCSSPTSAPTCCWPTGAMAASSTGRRPPAWRAPACRTAARR